MAHSRKILAQAGSSLADVYDVEGSVVGLEELDVTDVKGVHDLGPTIHSERLTGFMPVLATGAIEDDTAFNIDLASVVALPRSINRLMGVQVILGTTARIASCCIVMGEPTTGLDIVIWAWDSAVDAEIAVRTFGATVIYLRPAVWPQGMLPIILTQMGNAKRMPNIVFRGLTNSFGAGTVVLTATLMMARPNNANPAAGEPSSHGLPIPSW